MDDNLGLVKMVIEIIIFVPFVLFLFYISVKVGNSKIQSLQSGRYIKILERVGLSKENGLLVVKIGEKGYVISSCHDRIEILLEVSEEDLKKIEETRSLPQYSDIKELIEKFKFKKGDKNE